MRLTGKELAKMAKSHSASEVTNVLEEVLELGREGESGGVSSDDFSVRELFEHLVPDGREALNLMDPRNGENMDGMEAVNTSLFSAISGQLVSSKILEGYESEEFVFSRLIPATSTSFLDGEKITGLTQVGDDAQVVAESAQYPRSEFGAEYIETPATVKRGNIVSITREAVWADKTGQILRRANEIGEFLGTNKEKRLCDLAIGATNNYKRNGTSVDTYQTATPWINDHSNPLVDWTDIENAELLMAAIVDPTTGEPISLNGSDMVVSPFLYRTALRILNATEVTHTNGTNATSGSNPVGGAYSPIRSSYLASRVQSELSQTASNSKLWWLHGNFRKAMAYMEVWPITTVQAPQNSYMSFERDIVSEFKTSERGVAAVLDPRYMVRNKH